MRPVSDSVTVAQPDFRGLTNVAAADVRRGQSSRSGGVPIGPARTYHPSQPPVFLLNHNRATLQDP